MIDPKLIPLICGIVLIPLIILAIYGDKWLRKSTNWLYRKFNKDKIWLFDLQSRQGAELGEYLFCGIEQIDYSRLKELTPILVIRLWFVNASVFPVKHKEFHKLKVQCNGDSLPEPKSIPFQKVLAGRMNIYPFEFNVSQGLVAKLEKSATKCEFVDWSISLDWVFAYGEDGTTHLKQRNLKYRGIPEILCEISNEL